MKFIFGNRSGGKKKHLIRSPALCTDELSLTFTLFSEGKAEIVTSISESCVQWAGFYCVLPL